MTLLDQTLSFKLPTRKLTKKLIVNDTITHGNKSITKQFATSQRQKHEQIKEKQRQTHINVKKNHFIGKENPKKMMEGVILG